MRTRLSIVIAIGLLAAAVGGLAAPAQSATVYNVKTYGAKADGKTNDQAAFMKAIAAAAKAGGGVVYVPKGTYALRSVYLQSHVDVQVEGGTVFKVASGATNNESVFYLAKQGVYTQQAAAASFVEDVSVEGVNGTFTVDLRSAPTTRNHAFTAINVKGFTIANMNAMQNNTNRSGRAPTSYCRGADVSVGQRVEAGRARCITRSTARSRTSTSRRRRTASARRRSPAARG